MKDSDLTARALGESLPADAPATPQDAAEAARIAGFAAQLGSALGDVPEARLTLAQRTLILDSVAGRAPRWQRVVVLTALAACLVIAPFLPWFDWVRSRGNATAAAPGSATTAVAVQLPRAIEASESVPHSSGSGPEAPLPLGLGQASPRAVRSALASGRLPRPEEVNAAEIVNFFARPLPDPALGLFALESELTACPWSEKKLLLRLVLTARRHPAQPLVARDVAARLRFDQRQVAGWRLIGFNAADLPAAGRTPDIRPGQTVCLLYEIEPATPELRGELAELSISYSDADRNTRTTFQRAIPARRAEPSADALLSAAAAAFAFALVPESGRDAFDLALAQRLTERAGPAVPGHADLLQLIRQARSLL